LFADMW